MVKKLLTVVLSSACIFTAVSCGASASDTNQETSAETAAITVTAMTSSAKIKSYEEKTVHENSTGNTIETSTFEIKESAGSSTTKEKAIKPVESKNDKDFNSKEGFTGDDAVDLMQTGIQSLSEQDFESILKYTNLGDVCRMATDTQNSSVPTDEDILNEITNNKDKYKDVLSAWNDSAEMLKRNPLEDSDYNSVVHMTQDDLLEILDVLESLSQGKRVVPQYTDGYKVSLSKTEGLANLYVLKSEDGTWRFDICFGLMRDGLKLLKDQPS